MRSLVLFLAAASPCLAEMTVCQPTPNYSPCEITFELNAQDAAAHPNPYLTVELDAEFRSPRFRTFRMPAFWDGGRKLVIRFAPVDPGDWIFRVSSNIAEFNGKQGQFSVTPSASPGFLKPANVHHWAYVDDITKTPHLWMGDTLAGFPSMDRTQFQTIVDTRAAQKFNHIRGIALAPGAYNAGRPNPAYFDELDYRVKYMNGKGIIADLALGDEPGQIRQVFPEIEQRRRYLRYLVARYAGLNITWAGVPQFEHSTDGRALLKELGLALKQLDPYQHPRTTGAEGTSTALLGDEWMDFAACGSTDDNVGAIEHQLYAVPFVNAGLHDEDAASFRRHLWNATMDGQYPTLAVKDPDSAATKQMAAWFTFFANTRHWELEPYFDVDGGRALALEGVEYVVYVEKPGPVEVLVEKHGYDVEWLDPASGEATRLKKGYKGDHFTGEPPDNQHDWVLHISREGHKEGMLRSYKFESRPIAMQEIELSPQKAPFEVTAPSGETLSLSKPAPYGIKITRETRATRSMMFLWTGEAAAGQQGFRVIGTGSEGTLHIPEKLSDSYPVDMVVRVYGMNAVGKVYQLVKAYKLTR